MYAAKGNLHFLSLPVLLLHVTPVCPQFLLFRQYLPVFRKPSAFRRKRARSDRESPQDQYISVRCKKGEWEEIKDIISRIESHTTLLNEDLEREDDMNDTIIKNKKYSDRESLQANRSSSVDCEKGDPVQEIKGTLSRIESDIAQHSEELEEAMEIGREGIRQSRNNLNSIMTRRKYEKCSNRESPQDQYLSVRCKKSEGGEYIGILLRIETIIVRQSEELEWLVDDMNDMIRKYEKYNYRESPQVRCTKGEWEQISNIISRIECLSLRGYKELGREQDKLNDTIRKYEKCSDRESPQDQYLGERCKNDEGEQIEAIILRIESRFDRDSEMRDWFVGKKERNEEEIRDIHLVVLNSVLRSNK